MRLICLLRQALVCLPLASALSAAPIQWTAASGGNDNWYEYVPSISIFAPVGWAEAKAGAAARSHLGLPGYLATVTSEAEHDFIVSSFSFLVGFGGGSSAFLGASDEAQEGVFRWLGGPEAGELLTYTRWAPGHPTGLEDPLTLSLNYQSQPVTSFWTDTATGTFGYVVEYGDARVDQFSPVPEPSALLLSASGLALLWWRRRR